MRSRFDTYTGVGENIDLTDVFEQELDFGVDCALRIAPLIDSTPTEKLNPGVIQAYVEARLPGNTIAVSTIMVLLTSKNIAELMRRDTATEAAEEQSKTEKAALERLLTLVATFNHHIKIITANAADTIFEASWLVNKITEFAMANNYLDPIDKVDFEVHVRRIIASSQCELQIEELFKKHNIPVSAANPGQDLHSHYDLQVGPYFFDIKSYPKTLVGAANRLEVPPIIHTVSADGADRPLDTQSGNGAFGIWRLFRRYTGGNVPTNEFVVVLDIGQADSYNAPVLLAPIKFNENSCTYASVLKLWDFLHEQTLQIQQEEAAKKRALPKDNHHKGWAIRIIEKTPNR